MNINKKIMSLALLIITSMSSMALYQPAQGALQLGDQVQYYPNGTRSIYRGVIMDTLLGNDAFACEKVALERALHIPRGCDINYTYQEIMNELGKIGSMPKSQAINIVRAFEKAIMYQYDQYAYLVGQHKANMSIVFTGIQNPFYWFFYKTYTREVFEQIMDEMEHLQYRAGIHSLVEQARLKLIIHSYKHWKKYMLAAGMGTLIAIYRKDIKACPDQCAKWVDQQIIRTHQGLHSAVQVSKDAVVNVVHVCSDWVSDQGAAIKNYASNTTSAMSDYVSNKSAILKAKIVFWNK